MPRYSHAPRGFANRRFPAPESWVKTARRFIHVEDIVSSILASRERSGCEVFNLSGDRPISLRLPLR
jgi:nucleoside-diphosphate-sugar epimerase